jgi:hypothetical protein
VQYRPRAAVVRIIGRLEGDIPGPATCWSYVDAVEAPGGVLFEVSSKANSPEFMNRNAKFITMLLTGGLLAYASCCRSSEHRDQT